MNESQLRVAAPAAAFLTRRTPLHVTRGLETSALIAVLLLLAGCTGTGITGSTYQNHAFTIIATTGYSGALVEDSGTTPVSGSSNQVITFTASAGHQYTVTLWKTTADGQPLTLELVADETVSGVPTTVVVESQTTTDPTVPVRVGLAE